MRAASANVRAKRRIVSLPTGFAATLAAMIGRAGSVTIASKIFGSSAGSS
jgi:hypothetical protein